MRRTPETPVPSPDHTSPALGRARLVALLATLAAAVALVVGTVGPPLAGQGVFLSSDLVYLGYPWRAEADPVIDLDARDHGPTSDTVDAIYPARALFGESLRDGDFPSWNTWVAGGEPLGSVSNAGQLNPLALPFVLAPAWLAPALVKFAGLLTAVGFTYLFCRRLGTDRVPALVGGMVFAGSGFMVMWTNWPQVDVAAVIPALFWATERFLQRRTLSSAVPIALAVAAMLLGMFPAVVGYALYVLVAYVLVRVGVGLHRDREAARDAVVAAAKGAVGSGGAVVAGVALVAVVLLPFGARLASSDLSREQSSRSHLTAATLVTAIAPGAFGLSSDGIDYQGPARNQVESISFVGVTAVLLAGLGLALPTGRRAPPGARAALAGATIVLGIATYGGGPVLDFLQQLPVFGDNYIGRTRSVLGLTVGVLAALGLQSLLERVRGDEAWRFRWPDSVRFGAVVAAFGALVALVWARALEWADERDLQDVLGDAVRPALLTGAVAVAGILAVTLVRGWPRHLAAAGLAVLVAVQGLVFAVPLLPNEDRSTLYPDTPGLQVLRDNVGTDRVAGEDQTFYGNSPMLLGFRSLGGHAFFAPTWKDLLRHGSPRSFSGSPTLARLAGDPESAASPILDRMGVRWFAGIPNREPFGPRETLTLEAGRCPGDRASRDDGDTAPDTPRGPAALRGDVGSGASASTATATATATRTATAIGDDGVVTRLEVDGANGLRGVVVRMCDEATVPDGAALDLVAEGNGVTATGSLPLDEEVPARDIVVPVAGDDLAGSGSIDVTVTLRDAPAELLPVALTAYGTVAADLVRPGDDGLRLVYADELRIYERTLALPRIHWASRGEVVTDGGERVEMLAEGDVDDDTVLLSSGEGGGSGEGGSVRVLNDGDFIRLAVEAEGEGYVVVADALQDDWVATLDGASVDLVDADHAGVAVEVPAGTHEVELRFRPRGQRAGLGITGVTAVGLVAAGVASLVRQRRRRSRRDTGSPDPAPDLAPAPAPVAVPVEGAPEAEADAPVGANGVAPQPERPPMAGWGPILRASGATPAAPGRNGRKADQGADTAPGPDGERSP